MEAVFDAYPKVLRTDLLALRALILETAVATEGVGPLIETLKWGQPSYLPKRPRVGTTVRIDALKNSGDRYGLFVHCQTTLVRDIRERYGDLFAYDGNRALLFRAGEPVPRDVLRHCIAMALTYHLRRA